VPVGQNILNCGEIRKTVIINYQTLSNEGLVRTRGMSGRICDFCNVDKV